MVWRKEICPNTAAPSFVLLICTCAGFAQPCLFRSSEARLGLVFCNHQCIPSAALLYSTAPSSFCTTPTLLPVMTSPCGAAVDNGSALPGRCQGECTDCRHRPRAGAAGHLPAVDGRQPDDRCWCVGSACLVQAGRWRHSLSRVHTAGHSSSCLASSWIDCPPKCCWAGAARIISTYQHTKAFLMLRCHVMWSPQTPGLVSRSYCPCWWAARALAATCQRSEASQWMW